MQSSLINHNKVEGEKSLEIRFVLINSSSLGKRVFSNTEVRALNARGFLTFSGISVIFSLESCKYLKVPNKYPGEDGNARKVSVKLGL